MPPTYEGYVSNQAAPATMEPQVIKITAKQYEFIPARIEAQKGVPLKLILTSSDITHGFRIDEFKVNEIIEKGKATVITFTPNRPGVYIYYCSVFCGVGHSAMRGYLTVK